MPRLAISLAGALCLLTLLLRLSGLGCLLPVFSPLDSQAFARHVELYREEPENVALEGIYYPHLVSRTAAWLPDARRSSAEDLSMALTQAGDPQRDLMLVSLLFSLLILPATFLMARRWIGEWPALAATWLVATSLLHHAFSTQARPHGTAAAWISITVLAALLYRERGGWWRSLAAWSAAALALGSLHYGLFAIPPVLLAHLARREGRAGWLRIGAGALLLSLALWCFYPFYFHAPERFFGLQPEGLDLSGQPLKLSRFTGEGFLTIVWSLLSYDPVLSVLAGLGLVTLRPCSPRQWSADTWIASAFLGPYLLVVGLYDETWERFVLVLLPWIACLGARAVQQAWEQPARRFALLALLVIPGLICLQYALIKRAPSTFELMAVEVEARCSPEDRIVLAPHVDLPLFSTPQALEENPQAIALSLWLRYQKQHVPPERTTTGRTLLAMPGPRTETLQALCENPHGWLEQHRARYVVLAGFDPRLEWLAPLAQWLESHAQRLARHAADPQCGGALLYRHETDWNTWMFLKVLRAERMGQELRLYRLP